MSRQFGVTAFWQIPGMSDPARASERGRGAIR